MFNQQHKQHPLADLLVSIVVPSVILMKLNDQLGAVGALLLALAFPLMWGVLEFMRYRKWNIIAIFGLVSVVLTGGIGLLHIETKWLAVKEAAIPGVLGIALFFSVRMRHPFIRTLLYNPAAFDVQKI
ncbi:MAG: VC0807 family protein, partial [Patescibacteria group bacterium]